MIQNLYAVLRMVVGAYFLAKAVGLMLVPGRTTLLHALLPETTALTICASFFVLSGAFFLVGVALRPVAVLMAIHVLSSTILAVSLQNESVAVLLAQASGLIAAIVLVGFGRPAKRSKIVEFLRVRKALRSKLPQMPELDNMRQYNPEVEIDLTAKRPAIVNREEQDEWGDDDAGNLFDELWERKPRSSVSQVA